MGDRLALEFLSERGTLPSSFECCLTTGFDLSGSLGTLQLHRWRRHFLALRPLDTLSISFERRGDGVQFCVQLGGFIAP